MKYNLFLQQKGGTPDRVEAWSRFNDPIPNDGKPHGNSRRHGDASPAVQAHVIDTLIGECQRRGLSREDTAHVLAIARIESGFNPDAAAGQSSASGLGQFITKTGASYGLHDANRFDIKANTRALVDHYTDNQALARANGKDAAWVYKYHHDGPSKHSGGLGLAHKEVLPYARAYSSSDLLANIQSRAKAVYGEAKHQVHALVKHVSHEADTLGRGAQKHTSGVTSQVQKLFDSIEARGRSPSQERPGQQKPADKPQAPQIERQEPAHPQWRAATTAITTAVATTVALAGAEQEKHMAVEAKAQLAPEASKEAVLAKEMLTAPDLLAQASPQVMAAENTRLDTLANAVEVRALAEQGLNQGLAADAVKALVEHRFADAQQVVAEQLAALNIRPDVAPLAADTMLAGAAPGATTSSPVSDLASLEATSNARTDVITPSAPSATITLAQALADHMTEKGFDPQSVALAPDLAGRVVVEVAQNGAASSALVLHKEGDALASLVAKTDAGTFLKAGDSVLALDNLEKIATNGLDTDAVAALRGLAPEKTQQHSDLEVYQAAPAGLYAQALDPNAPLNSPTAVKEMVASLDGLIPRDGFSDGSRLAQQDAQVAEAKESQQAAMAMSA